MKKNCIIKNYDETFVIDYGRMTIRPNIIDSTRTFGEQFFWNNGEWYFVAWIGDKKYSLPVDLYHKIWKWDLNQRCCTYSATIICDDLKLYSGHCDSTIAIIGGRIV